MRIGITITKSTTFRGKDQEFHNTYHYNLATAVTVQSENIVDELVATERSLHSTLVTFKRAKVWTAGGSAAQNSMLFQKNLTGTGNQLAIVAQDKERAILIRWKAGFDSRGIQVYLRKWYHSCGQAAGVALDNSAITSNTGAIPAADRTTIANKANEAYEVGAAEFWQLCAASGRLAQSTAECHPYHEHHQLGEMWR